MKRYLTTSFLLSWGGRAVLTVVTAILLLLAILLVGQIHAAFLKSRDQKRHPQPIYVSNPLRPGLPVTDAHTFWPHFPGSQQVTSSSSTLNGVETICEDWRTSSSPADVLDYYRQQMIARGWRDITEETYALQPESRDWGARNMGVQDEKYLETYQKVIHSKLVLSRGGWCLHITAEPNGQKLSGTSVNLYAASTPSLQDFYQKLLPNGGSGLANGKTIDAVQTSAGERFHTTLSHSPLEPADAFQQALADAQANGWRQAMTVPPKQSGSGRTAWLTKLNQYAILTAEVATTGHGSSVSFMEVSPDHPKR